MRLGLFSVVSLFKTLEGFKLFFVNLNLSVLDNLDLMSVDYYGSSFGALFKRILKEFNKIYKYLFLYYK